MTKKIRQDIIDTLLKAKKVLITAHQRPDGDSLGSQLGLAGFLEAKKIPYEIVNEGLIPHNYLFLPNIESVKNIDDYSRDAKSFDTVVVIECSTLERIGEVTRLVDDGATVINIDHHQDNTLFGNINLKETAASAAGEIIYDLIKGASIPISRAMAISLYTAILTDTGRFHYSSTTPACLKAAAHLLECGADPAMITESIYFNLRPQAVRLRGLTITRMEYRLDGRLCLMTVDQNMLNETGANRSDTEGLINYSMYTQGVDVGVLFTEIDHTKTKVSFRSQNDIDVADIASNFGGGGHINASGCMVELPLEKAREKILKFIGDRLNGSV